ncbi:Methylated-DNA--protein-cysteine methyltransferase [hydrothermal vent metagenome]|uniref:methylated-DNA--[protein]-cysteine S-methyltransferase n=1 Tax=hydrothermal vent metagenome TaxID=652676 RepID=A0A3B1BL47_9ZZZZ
MSYQAVIHSPIGPLGIITDGDKLYSIDFLPAGTKLQSATDAGTAQVTEELRNYFKHADWHFSLSLRPKGTAFQLSVWQQLRQIPIGEVRSYGQIAKALGTGPRAVGNACRNNPLPIVVPCHRVVAATGPGGYDGQTGGRNMEIKGWLLAHEGVNL